jgi:hypothetical protein
VETGRFPSDAETRITVAGKRSSQPNRGEIPAGVPEQPLEELGLISRGASRGAVSSGVPAGLPADNENPPEPLNSISAMYDGT